MGVMVGGLAACGRQFSNAPKASSLFSFEPPEEIIRKAITLYDTNAMALYFDGGLGPKTGIIRVAAIIENKPVPFTFWHGHGGRDHQFTVTPEHFAVLKQLKRVTLQTTEVDGHSHKLFIDPVDPRYRVTGAKPVIIN